MPSQSGHSRDHTALAEELSALAIEAGQAVLRLAASGLVPHSKSDGSPITVADEAAEAIILAGLARLLPGVPVVSEEAAAPALGSAPAFLLVDPVDGTRELLAGREEFTVNIALIDGGVPVLGVVVAPASHRLWRGGRDVSPVRFEIGEQGRLERDSRFPLSVRRYPKEHPIALVSRSHLDAQSRRFLDRLGIIERRPCGSSLKFCWLAEGAADVYPRLAPTHEWDIAAGHAVLASAGGTVVDAEGSPIVYGGRAGTWTVPGFVAWGDPAAAVDRAAAGLPPPV